MKNYFILWFSLCTTFSFAQVQRSIPAHQNATIESNSSLELAEILNADTLVSVLNLPEGSVVTNLDCNPLALAHFFTPDSSLMAMNEGLLMTNGMALNVANPASFSTSASLWYAGDEDLGMMVSSTTHDACVIEMDILATSEMLKINYLFGSEEYPEYIFSSYADVFAILVSGPGIAGDSALNGQQNIALLPEPYGYYISINSANHEITPEYYYNNEFGEDLAYDGFVTGDTTGLLRPLVAQFATIAGEVYHVKMVIADAGDFIFDSGVFVRFQDEPPPVAVVAFAHAADYLIEGCGTVPDTLRFFNPSFLLSEDTVVYQIEVAGMAEWDVDYQTTLPFELVFPPNLYEMSFPISALADTLDEGVESIVFIISQDTGSGMQVVDTLSLAIHDQLEINIVPDADTLENVCGFFELSVEGADAYSWQPAAVVDAPFSSSVIATPTESSYVYVEGSIGDCMAIDSVWLDLFQALPEGDFTAAVDENTLLLENNSLYADTFMWFFGDGGTAADAEPEPYVYFENGTYEVVLVASNVCGSDTLTQLIEINAYPEAEISASAVSGCVPFVVEFSSAPENVTAWNWTFEGGDPPSSTDADVTVTYHTAGLYSVTLSVSNDLADSTYVFPELISVYDVPVVAFSFFFSDSTTVSFQSFLQNAVDFFWDFGDGTISSEQAPTHTYSEPGTYTVTLTAENACGPVSVSQDVDVLVTGTGELARSSKWSNFPNPVGGTLYLTYSGDVDVLEEVELHIFDLHGRLWSAFRQIPLAQEQGLLSFDVRSLPAGVYIARIRTGNERALFRFVKR